LVSDVTVARAPGDQFQHFSLARREEPGDSLDCQLELGVRRPLGRGNCLLELAQQLTGP